METRRPRLSRSRFAAYCRDRRVLTHRHGRCLDSVDSLDAALAVGTPGLAGFLQPAFGALVWPVELARRIEWPLRRSCLSIAPSGSSPPRSRQGRDGCAGLAGARRIAASRQRPSLATGRALVAVAAAVSLPDSSPGGWDPCGSRLWPKKSGRGGNRRTGRTGFADRTGPRKRVANAGAPEANDAIAPIHAPSMRLDPPATSCSSSCARFGRRHRPIHGWLKTTLAATERNATLHVAFCPPFDETPKFTVLQTSGPASRIKPVQLLPYGVRLELKRLEPGDKTATIVLEFSAESPLLASDATRMPAAPHVRQPPRPYIFTLSDGSLASSCLDDDLYYLLIFIGFPLLCLLAYRLGSRLAMVRWSTRNE